MREVEPPGTAGFSAVLDLLVAAGVPVPIAVLWNIDALHGIDIDRELDHLEHEGLVLFPAPSRVQATPSAAQRSGLTTMTRARWRGEVGRASWTANCFEAAVLAQLLLDGAQIDPDPTLVDGLLKLAERLHRTGDIDHEISVLRAVASAVDDGLLASPVSRARLLMRLGFALRFSGHADEAAELSARARAAARFSGDPMAVAVAALAWRPESLSLSDDPSSGGAQIELALRSVGDHSPAMRCRLLAAQSEATVFSDLAVAQAAGTEALALARTLHDPDALTHAGYAYRVAHWHPSRQQEMLALSTELVAVADQDVQYPEYGACIRLQVFFELGDWSHLDPELAAMGRRIDAAPRPYERLWHQLFMAARLQTNGRWDDAAALIQEGFELCVGPDYGSAFNLLLGQFAINAWQRGEDLTGFAQPGALPGGPMSKVWEAGLLAWSAGLTAEDRRRELGRLLPVGPSNLRPDMTYGLVLGLLASAAAEAGDGHTATLLMPELEQIGDQWLGFGGALIVGPNRLHLGRLASTLGRHDEALVHFRHAAAQAEAGRCEPWCARIDLARGEALDALGERTMAERAYRDARTRAEALGMAGVAARANELLASGKQPAGLTRREIEVLRLAAIGESNKAIAATLFLSIKTVERHLQNAYQKASLRNRAEAATFVARHQL